MLGYILGGEFILCAYLCYSPLLLVGVEAYPSASEVAQTNLSNMECGLPTQLSFSAREVSDGTFFKSIEDYDPESKRLLYLLEKWVLSSYVSFLAQKFIHENFSF